MVDDKNKKNQSEHEKYSHIHRHKKKHTFKKDTHICTQIEKKAKIM